jgi:nucleotide-binding universal stress UspA family protein
VSRFASILLPLDGSPDGAKGAGCALWLSETLGATLHVLHATTQPLPRREALTRLRVPDAQRAEVVIHQLTRDAPGAVLEAIEAHGVELVIISARGESASAGVELAQRVGSVAKAVIERSPVPVLLLPARYREALPWTSMLAAVSGEVSADRALKAAVHLAAALNIGLTVVHSEGGARGERAAPLGAYADAPHHEYPLRLQGMVERGLAGCTAEEGRCVNHVVLARGDPAAVLLEELARGRTSVLALGWHGALSSGRAPVLKRLLEEAECALLIVRASERSPSRLKVGEELDER